MGRKPEADGTESMNQDLCVAYSYATFFCVWITCILCFAWCAIILDNSDNEAESRLREMHNDVRKLTEGAMIAAVMGVLLLIDRQLAGLLLGYFVFVLPLPMVLYSARYGLRDSLIVFAAILILSLMFTFVNHVQN